MENKSIFKFIVGGIAICILTVLFLVAFYLKKDNEQKKAMLTYNIYSDIIHWEQLHPDARHWIFELDSPLKDNYSNWQFDDYLGYYELLYTLYKKDQIDIDLAYELLSNTLETIYKAHDNELGKMIQQFRKEENDPEIYIGIEKLNQEFLKRRKKIK